MAVDSSWYLGVVGRGYMAANPTFAAAISGSWLLSTFGLSYQADQIGRLSWAYFSCVFCEVMARMYFQASSGCLLAVVMPRPIEPLTAEASSLPLTPGPGTTPTLPAILDSFGSLSM